MTVEKLASLANFKAVCMPAPTREISGVYIGDLLSWVMSRADASMAWITIMSNANTVAVATLTDLACVILAEGVLPEDEVEKIATEKGVNILSSPLSSYETALKLSELLK